MKPVSQLVSLAASAAAILCSLTGCSSSTGAPAAHDTPTATATATADAAPDPKLDMPTVGECRALRAKDLAPAANATPPTDCSEPHTAITYAVGLLPASVDLVNMPHRRVSKVVSKRCGTGFRTAVGVEDVQLTTIQYAYFVPTKSEIGQGARWYRCDMVAASGRHNRELTSIQETSLPLLSGNSVPPRYQLCTLGGPKYMHVPCSEPHAFRAAGLWHVSGRQFPGKASLDAAGNQGCRKLLGNPSFWVWQTPNRFMWEDVDMHAIACFKSDG